jgi:hypothetical protein
MNSESSGNRFIEVAVSPSLSLSEQWLLRRLSSLWRSVQDHGLKKRWEMGAEMNKGLGSPEKRQAHGQAVLKEAARMLAISESELSRMRWLAHLFPDQADLARKHPGVISWTRFKKLLPSLRRRPAGGDGRRQARGKRARRSPFFASLRSAARHLRRPALASAGPELDEARKAFRAFVEEASGRLRVKVTFQD